MRRLAIAAIGCLLLFFGMGVSLAQPPAVLVKAHLEPGEVVNDGKAQVIVELQTSQPLNNAHMELIVPPLFQAGPSSEADIPAFQGRYTSSTFFVQRSGKSAPAVGAYSLLVRVVSVAGTSSTEAGEASLSFNYVSRISIPAYFLMGGAGILIGYGLRLLIKVLQAVPPPPLAPAPEAVPAVGRITEFVQKHYYLVDCSVTLVVGLLSLSLLLKNNHVPDSGLYWYSTLGSGVALGLLTNSELLSKLR